MSNVCLGQARVPRSGALGASMGLLRARIVSRLSRFCHRVLGKLDREMSELSCATDFLWEKYYLDVFDFFASYTTTAEDDDVGRMTSAGFCTKKVSLLVSLSSSSTPFVPGNSSMRVP